MEFGVLELGLKNQQLSSVKCFLRIQVEALRILRNECLQRIQSHPDSYKMKRGENNDQEEMHTLIGPYARHLQQWLQVFDKLALVINCTCRDHSSQSNRSFRFGLAVSVIALEIASSLIMLLDSDDEEVAKNDEEGEEEERGDHDMENEENVSKAAASACTSPLAACDLSFLCNLQEILGGIKQQVLPSSTTSNALLSNEQTFSQYEVTLLFPPPLVSSSSPSPRGVIVDSLHHLQCASASSSASSPSSGTASFSLLQAQAFLWNKFPLDRAKFKWQSVSLVIFNEFIQYMLTNSLPDTRFANSLLFKINLQLYPTLCVVLQETFDSQLRINALSWLRDEISEEKYLQYENTLNSMQILCDSYASCLRLNLYIMNSMTSLVHLIRVAVMFDCKKLPVGSGDTLQALSGSLIYSCLIKCNEVPRLLTYITNDNTLLQLAKEEQIALLQLLLFSSHKSSVFLGESITNQLLNIYLTDSTSLQSNVTIDNLISGYVKCRSNFFSHRSISNEMIQFTLDNDLNELLLMLLQQKHATSAQQLQSLPQSDRLTFIVDLLEKKSINCTFELIIAMEKLLKFNNYTDNRLSDVISASCLFFYSPECTNNEQMKEIINSAYEKVCKSLPLVVSCVADDLKDKFHLQCTSARNYDIKCNTSSLYYLLRTSCPVDIDKLFTWQESNIFRSSVNCIPTFCNNDIDEKYTGIDCKLDPVYFISQARPCQAFSMIYDARDRLERGNKSPLLNDLAYKASLIAYKNCKKVEITNGAILFQEVTLNDSANLRLHMAIGNFVSKYAGDFLGLKSHQQEIELGILLKKATSGHSHSASCTCSSSSSSSGSPSTASSTLAAATAPAATTDEQERAVIKLLQLVLTAFERKYHETRHISVEECLQWSLVINFCNHHRIQLPNDFLIKCAKNDDWLLFTIFCQMFDYPRECVIEYLSHFNNGCIADHLQKAFLSSACLSEKDDSPLAILKGNRYSSRPVSSVDSRKNLYYKIGVKQRSPKQQLLQQALISQSPALSNSLLPSSPISCLSNETASISSSSHAAGTFDDSRSVVSEAVESTYTVADNVSVLSRPLSSDSNQESAALPGDWINPPSDLYNLILACQRKTSHSIQQSLLISGVTFSNHVVILLASSIPRTPSQWCYSDFDVFCFWLTAVTQSPLTKKIRNYSSWTLENLIELLTTCLENIHHLHTLSLACKLLNFESSPLFHLIQFLIQFVLEKEHFKSVDLLKQFQQNYWKFNKNADDQLATDSNNNPFYSNAGIASVTVTLLKCSLESINNLHEIRLLLRHLDFSRVQSMFTSDCVEMINFNKLNRMAQVISDTDVDFPIVSLINYCDKSTEYITSVTNVAFKLQQKHHFTEANQLASIAGLALQSILLNEWKVKASCKHDSFEFWRECSAALAKIFIEPQSLYNFYNSFLPDINCLLCQAIVQLEMLKIVIDANDIISHAQWYNLEVSFYRTLMQIEFSQYRSAKSYDLLWNQIKQILSMMKDKDKCSITEDVDSDFELVESPIQVSSELLDQIVSKLVTGDLYIAKRFASIYSYHCKDLDLLIYMDLLGKGEPLTEVELNYLTSLGIKLPNDDSSDTLTYKQRLSLMQTLSQHISYCSQVASKRLLLFKISSVLSDISYEKIITSHDNHHILDKLITVSCIRSDVIPMAKEFITVNDIDDTEVAKIILNKLIASLAPGKDGFIMVENMTSDISSPINDQQTANSASSSITNSSNSFLSQLRLLNNSSVLGQQILAYLRNGVLDDQPLSITVEFYIRAHDCFSMSTDIEGISLVLRNVKCLVIQQLAPNCHYMSMIRILTGIGRYSEMTYIFDILKEHQKFELLLGRSIEKVPQLRIALLDSLKGDKEMYPMVALNFSMHREIAEMLHDEVMKTLRSIGARKTLPPSNVRDLLEHCLADLVDAAESFDKASCYNQSKKCALMAELVALQLHHLNSGVEFLNLSTKCVAQLIANHGNCSESVIVADAYNHHQSWPDALFNRVIKAGDWSYFREFTQIFGPPNDTLLDEIVTKCLQEYSVIKHGSNQEIALQKILSSSHNIEIYSKLSAKAGINVKVPSSSGSSDKESDAFFLDCMSFKKHSVRIV